MRNPADHFRREKAFSEGIELTRILKRGKINDGSGGKRSNTG